ncbi:hypothetical protein TNCV_1045951 [Trichonephila clavipes]|nr:hypothetical protein TNCV_1045951 [Trichonephila clavipes]
MELVGNIREFTIPKDARSISDEVPYRFVTNVNHIYTIFTPDKDVRRGPSGIVPSCHPGHLICQCAQRLFKAWANCTSGPEPCSRASMSLKTFLSVCLLFMGNLQVNARRSKPHSLQELQKNISGDIPAVQLRSAFPNLLTKAQKCQEMNGGHFQHLLCVRKHKNSLRFAFCKYTRDALKECFLKNTLLRSYFFKRLKALFSGVTYTPGVPALRVAQDSRGPKIGLPPSTYPTLKVPAWELET